MIISKLHIVSLFILFGLCSSITYSQNTNYLIARLKYGGGGDWYNDPSAEVNLITFLQNNTNLRAKAEYKFVDVASDEIFQYPILFITGHGNIVFSDSEIKRLRSYLDGGGFLYIDDDYGLDKAVRREMKRIFPDQELQELPFSYLLYSILFPFPYGPPKTHKHDEKTPQGLGIFIDKRLAVYYTFESNPSDGWVDKEVHQDPEEKRIEALKFGANIILFALTQ